MNQGSLHAIAGGVAGANSIAASSILPLSAPAHAQSLATFNTLSATGVTGGDGNNLVLNESDLNVTAGGVSFVLDDGALVVWPGTDALASARADGDGAWSGWGTAIATARADNAVARGIYLSGGDNVVRNSDSITVIANPIADAHAVADADGISFSIPNATATTLTSANNALAVGIELGHGDNEVLNENMLTVIASPLATEAEGDASAGPGEVGIDAFVTTVAQANDSRAYGIRTGGGANTIWNTGTPQQTPMHTA